MKSTMAGFKPEQHSTGAEAIPAGVYVAKIISVKEEDGQFGPILKMALDIAEGDFAGAYKRRYDADVEYARNNPQLSREARWKGTVRYNIPVGNDPERDGRNLNRINDAMWRIEQSNPGLHIDWKMLENQLPGKLVGINVRDAEYNGIQYTEIGRLETVDDVRNRKVKPMSPRKPRDAQNSGQTSAQAPVFTPVDTEVPF